MKRFSSDFLTCGVTGWCMEILFTGIRIPAGDRRMMGTTSVWMFPIYGMASLLKPVCRRLKKRAIWARGSIYAACIFTCEYLSGSFLRKFRACPWDYSASPYNIHGLIRLDYAPIWFCVGLLFEKILCRH